jgi:hypothetical protein
MEMDYGALRALPVETPATLTVTDPDRVCPL